MAYNYQWLDDGFIIEFSGEVTIRELIMANSTWKNHKDLKNFKKQVWDFSNANLDYVFESDAQDREKILSTENIKVAFIAGNDYTRHLVNVFIKRSLETGSDWSFQIVETMREALEWTGMENNRVYV